MNYNDEQISWSRDLKADLKRARFAEFSKNKIREALYRPFTSRHVFFDRIFNEEVYGLPSIFPLSSSGNKVISLTDVASRSAFSVLASDSISDLHLCASIDTFQCFPFYTYAEDGIDRHENITDWALEQFRSHYGDPPMTKWDIFHYVYAVLHHLEYRERYTANLRRELPRIPFVAAAITPTLSSRAKQDGSLANHPAKSRDLAAPGDQNRPEREFSARTPLGAVGDENPSQGRLAAQANTRSFDSVTERASASSHSAQDDSSGEMRNLDVFRAFVKAGQRLAEIHVHYEQQPEYALAKTEKKGEHLDYRVEKMKLSKDKTTLIYNRFLTLSGIPPETFEYRLGNRSALEWIVDQYQVSTDKRSGIVNDPNREDDPEYILRLIGQVVTVSLETVKIVKSLPPLGLHTSEDA